MSDRLSLDLEPGAAGTPDLEAAKIQPREVPANYGVLRPTFRLESHNLADYSRAIYKYRWPAIASFALIVGLTTVYTFTATPIYQGSVQLLIEPENPNVVSFKEVIEQTRGTDDYYQTQYRILQSRVVARKTLDSLDLWKKPPFGSVATEPSKWNIGNAIRKSGSWVKSFFMEPSRARTPDEVETAEQSAAINTLLSNLDIVPVRNSRLVDVRYESEDPVIASHLANALAHAYIEQTLAIKYTASKDASDFLGSQMAEQRQKVQATEQALQKYREQNDALSLEDRQNIVVQKLADLNAAVTRAKTERIQKQAAYDQLKSISATDATALDTFPAIQSNTFIQQQKTDLANLQARYGQLSERLGERHQDIINIKAAIQQATTKLQAEINKVVQSVRNEYLAALSQEQSLTAALNQQKAEAQSMDRKAIDYGVLKREADSNRQMFDSLLQRAKETNISGELKSSNIRIVDVAETPRTPVSPNKKLNLTFAFVFGGLFSVGLALLLDRVDGRVRTPEEIQVAFGLPCLGFVPAIADKTDTVKKDYLLTDNVPPSFAEAIRSLRTNVLFSSASSESRCLVVTSTAPGEGKTMTSVNLAIAIAQSGQRVLIIDADLRRPRVHSVFEQPQTPGLSNVIVGNAKAAEAVKKTQVPGFWVMPSGDIPPNPAELLGSKRFADLLRAFAGHFDWIIIDSPPVMAVTDAAVISHVTSGVLFVIAADQTSRTAAGQALEQLGNVGAKVLGAILNRVDLERNPYYYKRYYRREYAAYYRHKPVA